MSDVPPEMPPPPAEHRQLTPEQYAATLSPEDRKYRSMYMDLFKEKGCKGYCVAGTGGREPRSGACPFCHAT